MPAIPLVESDAVLPPSVDVVIIGGGIIGVSAALTLSERGVSVLLCEKGEIGAEQSSRNWGWVRVMGRDAREIPLSLASLEMWRGLDARYGIETGFTQSGIAYLCRDEKEVENYRSWNRQAGQYGIRSRLLSEREVSGIARGTAVAWKGALYTETDGRAEPFRAAMALAGAARAHGATLLTRCAVRGIEFAAGRVAGVVTEMGPVRCSSVVVAGGAWSRLLLGNHGIDLPQLKLLSSVMRTAPMTGPTEGALGATGFGLRKRRDGGYTLAERNSNLAHITPDSFRLLRDYAPTLLGQWSEFKLRFGRPFFEGLKIPRTWKLDQPTVFERVRIEDPAPDEASLRLGLRNIVAAFPEFRDARIVERWAGYIDVTPDAVPVISRVENIPGLVVATGFSGHGFGIGPGAGMLAADLVTGGKTVVDPAPYDIRRFRRAASSLARPELATALAG